MNPTIATSISCVGILVSVLLARGAIKQRRKDTTSEEFILVRKRIKEDLTNLNKLAFQENRRWMVGDKFPLLAAPGWIPLKPIPLERINVRLSNTVIEPSNPPKRLVKYWPRQSSGKSLLSYHEAVSTYDPPANWFNGVCYRLLGIYARHGAIGIDFGVTRYWQSFDTSESLAYEAAWRLARNKHITGKYRRWLGDPFDFNGRSAVLCLNVFTVRRSKNGSTFYMHQRGADDVAVAMNMIHVVPGGEFTPSDDSPMAIRSDFDLWKSVLREYAEEFLGHEEARIDQGAPINYTRENPYAILDRARRKGCVTPYVLGISLDPLNWKPELHIACIFEAETFDDIFASMVRRNAEGVIRSPSRLRSPGKPIDGWVFDATTVADFLGDWRVTSGARTCLYLAWNSRVDLQI